MELWGQNEWIRQSFMQHVDCSVLNDINQLDRFTGHNLFADFTGGTVPSFDFRVIDMHFFGCVESPRDKWCLAHQYALLLATRCPEYGKPISGIGRTFLTQLRTNCRDENIHANDVGLRVGCGQASNSYGQDLTYFGLPVVPDNTPFALNQLPFDVSGIFEHWAGFDAIKNYNQSTRPDPLVVGRAFPDDLVDYDCDIDEVFGNQDK